MSGTLVVGIGNRLLGADAFGPEVVAQLSMRTDLPADVVLVDAGSDLFTCLDRFADSDRVVIVDAFLGEGTGTVSRIDESTFSRWPTESPGVHEISAVMAVALFRRLYPSAGTSIVLIGLDAGRASSSERVSPAQVEAGVAAVRRAIGNPAESTGISCVPVGTCFAGSQSMGERLEVPTEDPEAKLERALMEEYLRRRNHSFSDLGLLTPDERHRLLDLAAKYAAGRLAEIGARAHFVEDLHKHE